MKSVVIIILSSLFVAGIQGAAYDWKTPEGCSCSCPITYKGPYPPPSSILHTRDPWSPAVAQPYNPYYNTWNRPGIVDPYVDPYRTTNPYYNNKWNQQWNTQWNRTWPYTGTAGQWGSPSAWNRNQWNSNQTPYYLGYAHAAVANNEGDDVSSSEQSNIEEQSATSTHGGQKRNAQNFPEDSVVETVSTGESGVRSPGKEEIYVRDNNRNSEIYKRDTKESVKHDHEEGGNVESRFDGGRSRLSGASYGNHNNPHGGISSSSFGQGQDSSSFGQDSRQGSSFGSSGHHDHHHSSGHGSRDHGSSIPSHTSGHRDEGRSGKGHSRGGSKAGIGSGIGGGFGVNFGFGGGAGAGSYAGASGGY